jgi:hypothetical protein
VIVNADNVSRISFFDVGPILGHEDGRIGKGNLFADPVVKDPHSPPELAGADPQESDPVTVAGIHVGLNLKDETRKSLFIRGNVPGLRWT